MLLFVLQAIIISLSGVMAPGPITAATIGTGARSPHAGVLVAIGHGIIEFPLMVFIYYGLGHVLEFTYVKATIFTLGGLFLLLMGLDMLRTIKRVETLSHNQSKTPLVAGILLSMGNAYFLLWWASVGATLISKAVAFGLTGVLTFAVVHWLCDFVWLYFLSAVSFKGGNVFGITFQKVMFGMCGSFLLFFSLKFLMDAVYLWHG